MRGPLQSTLNGDVVISCMTSALIKRSIVVYTTRVNLPGGYENLARELAASLAKLGHRVTLLCHYSTTPVNCRADTLRMAISPDVEFLDLGMPISPKPWQILGGALRLRKLLRSRRVDFVEVSGFGPSILACVSTLGTPARVAAGVHYVASLPTRPSLRQWIWRLLAKCCRQVVFYGVSEASAAAWARYIGYGLREVAAVPNAAGRSLFSENSRQRGVFRWEIQCDTQDRIVLCAGRIMKSKGQMTVLEAIGPLLGEHRLRLVFAGRPEREVPDDSDFPSRLRAVARDLSVSDRVHFVGLRTDLPEIMRQADLLVHAPTSEAFGVVLAEAMAVGLPIVASNVGGIPEVLRGTSALLVPPCHVASLRQAVIECLGWSESQRQQYAITARLASQRYHPDHRALAILQLFEAKGLGGSV
jgi:glycosyltransferase involved in cell wall biosynthesis